MKNLVGVFYLQKNENLLYSKTDMLKGNVAKEVSDMGKEEVQKNYTVTSSDEMGQVQISNEVVTIIAGLAATEVKGVASMVGNITNELVSKLGIKNLAKGVKIMIENDVVSVDLALNLDYGYSIPKTCQQVQEKVKSAIESMTGLKVETVNVKIANVTMENGK